MRLLIVEDHPTMLKALGQMVEILGHEAVTAGSLAEATAACDATIDVILCDYRLPDGDATSWLGRLRDSGCSASCLLMTAYATGQLDADTLAAFDAVLTKPFGFEQLEQTLAQVRAAETPAPDLQPVVRPLAEREKV